MIVPVKHCFVFEFYGKSYNVDPFNNILGSVKDIQITDADIDYYCPYSHEFYILICRNSLYLPNMEYNLLPPFIMREIGSTVNDTPKIHCTDITSKDHCITFSKIDMKIPLHINSTFYIFHKMRPTADEIQSCEKILIPSNHQHCNTYCILYELNEVYMWN